MHRELDKLTRLSQIYTLLFIKQTLQLI